MNEQVKEGALRVWWAPQVPCPPFHVPVKTVKEAVLIVETLERYDAFQFDQKIKPDYCNAGGLEVYEDGEWTEWSSDEYEDILDMMRRSR